MRFEYDKKVGDFKFQHFWNEPHWPVLDQEDIDRINRVSPNYLDNALEIRKYTSDTHVTRVAVVKEIKAGEAVIGRLFWFNGTETHWW